MFDSFPVEASDNEAAADDVDSSSQGYALPSGINIIIYKVTHHHRFFLPFSVYFFESISNKS
jgi:hypothetical protein